KEVTITSMLSGRVQPFLSAEVRPQVSGIVKERRFEEGQRVEAGDILYVLDDRTYLANYKSARAAYMQQQSREAIVKNRLERAKKLYAQEAVSKEDLEEASLNYELARADLSAALAELERCKVNLSYTRVSAPISGEVGKTEVSIGALVTAEQSEPLTVVRQLDQVYVDVQQSARQWRRLRSSILFGELTTDKNTESVVLYLEDGRPYPQQGQLILAEPAVDESSGSVTLRALFENKHHLLLPGMAVQAKVIGGINPHSLVIPARAVVRDPKGQTFAYVLVNDSRVQRRKLTLGILSSQGYEVLEGLADGDEVVISGLSRLRDGAQVMVKNLVDSQESAQ
ncbi:MAG: efflux RND transporter periplasmic adaptor subunit, partial [Proteobacteria bacterium]|nr:efflux RND transporter periplasmic adaptor subunit [Candidatus Avisuccinivibrio stercorigallinarum]